MFVRVGSIRYIYFTHVLRGWTVDLLHNISLGPRWDLDDLQQIIICPTREQFQQDTRWKGWNGRMYTPCTLLVWLPSLGRHNASLFYCTCTVYPLNRQKKQELLSTLWFIRTVCAGGW
ncbi:unnamed protein product [Laminaria digitata]